jgi:NitT/TauT family transport system substrate-binding protein
VGIKNIFRALGIVLFFAGISASASAKIIKVGYLPVPSHAKFMIAKEAGFFKQEGLDVELVEFQNSADGLNAIIAGKLDTGAFGTMAPIAHVSKGTRLKIIGGIMGGDSAIITRAANAASIKSAGDLKGKKIVTVRMASGDAVLRGGLADAGIDWKKDAEIIELKNPPAVIEAVKSGQVDAGVVWGPHDLRAEEQGLKIVLRSQDLHPRHPCCRIVVTEKEFAHHDQWARFMRAILRAEKFAAENHRETIAIVQKYVKLDKNLLERSYYSPHLDQSSDPNVKGVKRFADVMVSSKYIPAGTDIRSAIDTETYKKALDGLAKEEPNSGYWKKLQREFREKNG